VNDVAGVVFSWSRPSRHSGKLIAGKAKAVIPATFTAVAFDDPTAAFVVPINHVEVLDDWLSSQMLKRRGSINEASVEKTKPAATTARSASDTSIACRATVSPRATLHPRVSVPRQRSADLVHRSQAKPRRRNSPNNVDFTAAGTA
jgi:hypothetical protein